MSSVQHLQSLQQNRKCICKLITTRITAQTRHIQFGLAVMMKKIHCMSKGENSSDRFLIYLIIWGRRVIFRCGFITSGCFSSPPPSCRKAGRSQRQAVPEGSMHLTQTHTLAQKAFKLGLKDLKTFLISFSFARIRDASFVMLTLALVDQGTGCLWFACRFPWGPALLPGCSPCRLPSNTKYRVRSTHREGERFATCTQPPPGIQDQDQDVKSSKRTCCELLTLFCLYSASCSGQVLSRGNAPRNLVITLILFC